MSLAILSVSPFSVGGKYPSLIADFRAAKYAVCVLAAQPGATLLHTQGRTWGVPQGKDGPSFYSGIGLWEGSRFSPLEVRCVTGHTGTSGVSLMPQRRPDPWRPVSSRSPRWLPPALRRECGFHGSKSGQWSCPGRFRVLPQAQSELTETVSGATLSDTLC